MCGLSKFSHELAESVPSSQVVPSKLSSSECQAVKLCLVCRSALAAVSAKPSSRAQCWAVNVKPSSRAQ